MNPKSSSGGKKKKGNVKSKSPKRNKMSRLSTASRVSPMLKQKNSLDPYLDLVNPKEQNDFDNGE